MELTLHEHSPPGNVAVESKLTGREREVLQRVAGGERNKEIAARLGISEPTVKSHLASIYFKLGVDSRASAVAVALERGLLSFERKR
jgi:NarL family two-component system response regulator YdfI